MRWGPGDLWNQEVLGKHVSSLTSGHPWLPLASWGHLPIQPSHVFPKCEVYSFLLNAEASIIHYPTFTALGFQELCLSSP